ncbi:hypothetical protein [Hyphomicrobium sp. 2TAF46]|uniref:hypothetical protein n=1 Tax=Hyphomicrobium sp. 2TAF46 TaxID=3233019 RepID=UPI003F937D9F
MSAKTNYIDQTIATNPPGGKHHETRIEGMRRPTERPAGKSNNAGRAKKVAKSAR